MRWVRRIALGTLLIVLVLAILFPAILRYLVSTRLQAMISDQLNASLRIGDLSYHFPYRVDVTDAAIVAPGPDNKPLELLQISHLGLELAQSPLKSGPLVIQSIVIDQPSIHMIRLADGLVGRRLTKAPDETSSSKKNWKLSEMFRLRHLELNQGQVVYEDRSLRHVLPLVWKNLSIVLNTDPQSRAQYGFHFVARDAPVASLDARGTADIDALLLRLDDCVLGVQVDPTQPHSALPPEYQQLLESMGVRGGLSISTAATLPLNNLKQSTYNTVLQLQHASADVKKWKLHGLTARLRCSNTNGRPALEFEQMAAECEGARFDLSGGSLSVDPRTLDWSLKGLAGRIDAGSKFPDKTRGIIEFTLTASGPLALENVRQLKADLHLLPVGCSLQPPVFVQPINQFAEAELSLAGGVLSVQRLRAAYGSDIWFVKQAEVDVSDFPRKITLRDAQGCLTFAAERSIYPKEVEDILSQLNPAGPWFFDASASVPLSSTEKVNYQVLLHTARGRLALTDRHLPVYDIHTNIAVTPAAIDIQHLEGGTLQGNLRLNGRINLAGQTRYAVNAVLRSANLRDLARFLATPGTKQQLPLSGSANLKLNGSGIVPEGDKPFLNFVRGNGEFEIHNGDFWQIPVMQGIANAVGQPALRVSDAAGVFTVSNGALHLQHAAVSAPALGVEGSGDIRFDGTGHLEAIATVLGEWSDKIDSGDQGALNNIASTVQGALNFATRQVLYQIHVTGHLDDPVVKAEFAPFLSRETAQFIVTLKGKPQDDKLLNYVKDHPAQSAQPTSRPAAG